MHTRFPDGEVRHGGVRRSLQVRELFESCGWNYQTFLSDSGTSRSLFVEEDSYSIARGRRRSFLSEFVAWPHNIEHLVKGQFRKSQIRRAKLRELRFFRQSCQVVTISRYDAWYLAQHGILAETVPYYPPREIEATLLDIRLQRSHSATSGDVLVIGTYGNPPTAEAVVQIIREYAKQTRKFRLLVVGFGSERLAQITDIPAGVELLGSIDEQGLRRLMTSADAALVHQSRGTGALTRIAEFLVSGLPIVATPIAARGYERIDGVTIAATLKHALEKTAEQARVEKVDYRLYKAEVEESAKGVLADYERRLGS